MGKEKSKTGPDPDRLKIEGEWEKAVEKAINVKRPPGGWPKPKAQTPKKKGRARK